MRINGQSTLSFERFSQNKKVKLKTGKWVNRSNWSLSLDQIHSRNLIKTFTEELKNSIQWASIQVKDKEVEIQTLRFTGQDYLFPNKEQLLLASRKELLRQSTRIQFKSFAFCWKDLKRKFGFSENQKKHSWKLKSLWDEL